MNMQAALEEYLRYLQYEKRVSAHTFLAYREDLKVWNAYLFAQYEIDTITQIQLIHLRSWLIALIDSQALKPASVKRKVSSVNSFFKYGLKQGWIQANPAKNLKAPKIPHQVPQYIENKQALVLEHIVQENETNEWKQMTDQLILDLLYQTGMRRSELLGLKNTDIDWNKKEVKVLGKRRKERIIPLSESILNDLKKYVENKEEVCINSGKLLTLETGKPVSTSYVYRVVHKYLSAVSTLKKRSPHILRHTFASELLNNGADLSAIQKLLGHDSLAATQIYTHTNIEKLKDVYRKAHPKSAD